MESGAEFDAAAVGRIDVAEAVEQAGVHQVQRNLAGGIEIVAAEDEAEAELLAVVQRAGVVGVDVVAAIAAGTLKRPVGVGAFVGDVGVDVLRVGAEGEEAAAGVEIAALQAHRELLGQGFALADVHHAQAAEIAILRAEGAVDDGDVLDQFRAERLQRAEVALAVALRALILLDVVHQHLQPAVDAAVIEIEAEAADLERLAAAFMLAGVDAGIQLLQHLIVAREQGAVEDLGVAQVDGGFHRLAVITML